MTAPRPTRRELIAGAVASAMAAAIPRPLAAEQETLGGLAAAKGLLFGASFAVHELDAPHGPAYAAMYKREARVLTSELELKPGTLRPAADRIDFAPADRLFAFAAEARHAVRGHTLIWNDYLPDWIKRLGPGEVEHLLEAHIDTVMTRYAGRVHSWDVVNEPIAPWDKKPGNLRDGPFYAAMGEAYIARSFRLARRADPAAKLVLNEAFTETDDERGETYRRSFMTLLARLKDDGAPIDAIGLQCHLSSKWRYDFARYAAFLQQIADMGFDLYITELDVDDAAFNGGIALRDARVADLYARFLAAVLALPAVKVLTLWQMSDRTSWLNSLPAAKPPLGRKPRPLPYDEAFSRKPVWEAIAQAFKAMPPR